MSMMSNIHRQEFIKECLKLDKECKLPNLNYLRKIIEIEYENGTIDSETYKKYISLSSDKNVWGYEDWKLFLGIKDKI